MNAMQMPGSPTMDPMNERASAYGAASQSPLEVALDRVGDRWSLLLVDALLTGGRRFGELREELPGLAPNILTERLRRLEREGIVVATPYSTRPPRMEYSLTGDGRDLASALRLLADWGNRRHADGEPLRHDRCGTAIEARWYCPTCASPISDEETDGRETRIV
jgi:DNA-binding HxlR family transcriptional regulator